MDFMWVSGFCKRRVCYKDYLMKRVIYIGFIVVTLTIIATMSSAGDKVKMTPLGELHQKIMTDYPSMSHISRTELEKQLTSDAFLILDIRPAKEYNVSHIAGALQVDPDISSESFRTRYGKAVKNKRLIVYCSVGHRSSDLGERLQNTALNAGAVSVQNMEGGLFGWHNDNRPLVNASGSTSGIHPYNAFWGRLIENKDAIRYNP